MHNRRHVSRVLLALLAFGALACQGKPIPLSAQAGSTITLPLGFFGSGNPTAHGGIDYADPQRGEYVFALDAPAESGGFELTTRFVAAVNSGPSADYNVTQYIAYVDLAHPLGDPVPLGTRTIHASHRWQGDTVPLPSPMTWEIAILPPALPVEGETVTGEPTPNEFFNGSTQSWQPFQTVATETNPYALESVIPRPTLQLGVKNGYGSPWATSALVLDVSFPDDRIQVIKVAGNDVWYHDLGVVGNTRTLRVSGFGSSFPLRLIPLVFELKGSLPLLVSDVNVTVVKATNTSLAPIASTTPYVAIH